MNNKPETIEPFDIEEILDDLGSHWATPEAQHFFSLMKEKKFTPARKMLKDEGYAKEKVDFVIDHFKKKFAVKKKLVEYFPFEFENFNEDDKVLVSYGGSIVSTTISKEERYTHHKGNCFFDNNSYGYVPLSEATQVWKIQDLK